VKTDSTCLDTTTELIFPGARAPQAGDFEMSQDEVGAGSAAIFWELLAPVSQKIYNFIRKAVNFSQDADDIFQESVLQALRYFRTFRRGAKFETWLFSIAHNEVRKHFKNVSRAAVPLDAVPAAAPDLGRRDELVREVFRFAGTLSPRPRLVFFLFYDSGFSIGEISEITGLREGNIKFILNQARANLRAIMGESDE